MEWQSRCALHRSAQHNNHSEPGGSAQTRVYPLAILIDCILPIGPPPVSLKFFERVGSEDKLYDFIVEADSAKAIGPDRFARDFRSFRRRHSEKCS